MMRNGIFLTMLLFVIMVVGCALPSGKLGKPSTVLKHYQFSALDSLMLAEQHPVAVFLHTDWCKYCENMEQTTVQNKEVVELLNSQYYFIPFDGEKKDDVTFRNHLFQYQPTGRNTGTHELATALGTMEGSLTYPTFLILNSDYEIVFQYNAFLTAEEMVRILKSPS